MVPLEPILCLDGTLAEITGAASVSPGWTTRLVPSATETISVADDRCVTSSSDPSGEKMTGCPVPSRRREPDEISYTQRSPKHGEPQKAP